MQFTLARAYLGLAQVTGRGKAGPALCLTGHGLQGEPEGQELGAAGLSKSEKAFWRW